jgi:hypothetical protein
MKTNLSLLCIGVCLLAISFSLKATTTHTPEAELMPCDPPFLLEVTGLTTTTADLVWTPVGQEMLWDVAVLPKGSPPPGSPTAANINSTSYTHTGLSPGTAYDFYVRAVCIDGPGNWAKYNSFFVTYLENGSGCQLGLDIPDSDCVSFTLDVNNAPGTVMGDDVYLQEVHLIVEHSWADDVELFLQSPNGTTVTLAADHGGEEDNYGNPEDTLCQQYTILYNIGAPNSCAIPTLSEGTAPFLDTFLTDEALLLLNDGSNPNSLWTIEICDDAGADVGQLEFIDLIFAPLTCAPPVEVSVTELDSTFVDLVWIPGSNCAMTLVEFGPPGFTPGIGLSAGPGGTVLMTGCPPFELSGLDPETDYVFYIRENCGDGTFSDNSCPVEFTTPCSPIPPTNVEDFNAESVCIPFCSIPCNLEGTWFNVNTDDMDWQAYEGNTPTTNTGPTDDYPGGGRYIYMETTGPCPVGGKAELYSNCIQINAPLGDTCNFGFNYLMYGGGVASLTLEITLDGGENWTTLWTASGDKGQDWLRKYIDMNAYDGLVGQFRFTAIKGATERSDIALDNLIFYGSEDLGDPDFLYYLDADNDGYGDPNIFVASCAGNAPPGFVDNDLDCYDLSDEINPDQEETPCDGFDVNCNGFIDEFFLPTPLAMGDTICSGELALIKATPAFNGNIIWYDVANGGVSLDTGLSFVPQPALVNNSDMPIIVTYYAEEFTNDGCFSPDRAEVMVLVNPKPSPFVPLGQFSGVCSGDVIDLGDIIIQDQNNTNATYTFHTEFPPTPGNQLTNLMVNPTDSTYYYINAESEGGCIKVDSFLVPVLPSPDVEIIGAPTMCVGGFQALQAVNNGDGVPPFTYLWNTAESGSTVQVNANVPAGSQLLYSVTLTDGKGCQSADTFLIDVINSIDTVFAGSTPVTDCDGGNGLISLAILGGTPPFQYEWVGPVSGMDTSPISVVSIDNLEQGSYDITLTDSSPEACPYYISNVIVNGPVASIILDSIINLDCPGDMNGCIFITVEGLNPMIQWSNNATTEDVCGLSGGIYSVTVTDTGCENILNGIQVFEPDTLLAKISEVQDVSCFGLSDGAISLLVGGGTPPYQFEWSNMAMTQNLTDLPSGSYTLTITDAIGCSAVEGPFFVDQPDSLEVIPMITPVTCTGEGDGAINAIVSGGTPPYAYLWEEGQDVPNIDGLEAGTYSLTVTDQNDCQAFLEVILENPDALSASIVEVVDASCWGAEDGVAAVGVTGGSLPYSFLWSTGDTDSLITDLIAGFYTVTVTDASECSVLIDSFYIGGPDLLDATTQTTNTSCFGLEDGSATVIPISGTGPYDFIWENGVTDSSQQNISAGEYPVTITDAAGCRDTVIAVVESDQTISTLVSVIRPNCNGGSNGSIFVTPFGGIGPYEFEWNTGQMEDELTGISGGAYVVTVTDNTDCFFVSDTIWVEDPPEILIEVLAIDSVSCAGAMDGGIEMLISGGVEPYMYTWNTEATTEDIYQLGGGMYTLTVEDSINCTKVGPTIFVPEPEPLLVEVILSDDDVDCNGNQVDSVFLEIEGGTAPYIIEWSNGDSLLFLQDINVGEYDVLVTDMNGCEVFIDEIKIPDPVQPLMVYQDTSTLFVDNCDSLGAGGTLRAVIDGGYLPYQFNWSNGATGVSSNDTLILQGVSPGDYNVTLTDDRGCVFVSDSFSVVYPGLLTAFIPTNGVTDVSCVSGSDGAVNVMVSGGVEPYTFVWVNGQNDTVSTIQNPQGLPAGNYTLTITDFIECFEELSNIEIDEPDVALSATYTVEHVLCFGDSNGQIDLSPSGGTQAYQFLWSNDSEEQDLTNIPAGFYSITITDHLGCTWVEDSIEITQPADSIQLVEAEIIDANCFGNEDGGIDITVSGGEEPYSFIWSNDVFSEDNFFISSGDYHCLIADANGCTYTTPDFFVDEPDPLQVTDEVIEPSDPFLVNGSAEVTIGGGTIPYTYLWSNGDTTPLADSLADGLHSVTVTDSLGCELTHNVFVPRDTVISTQWVNPDLPIELVPNPTNEDAWLMLPEHGNHTIQLQVFDVLGQSEIYRLSDDSFSGDRIPIRMEDQPSGVYLIHLELDGKPFRPWRLVLLR